LESFFKTGGGNPGKPADKSTEGTQPKSLLEGRREVAKVTIANGKELAQELVPVFRDSTKELNKTLQGIQKILGILPAALKQIAAHGGGGGGLGSFAGEVVQEGLMRRLGKTGVGRALRTGRVLAQRTVPNAVRGLVSAAGEAGGSIAALGSTSVAAAGTAAVAGTVALGAAAGYGIGKLLQPTVTKAIEESGTASANKDKAFRAGVALVDQEAEWLKSGKRPTGPATKQLAARDVQKFLNKDMASMKASSEEIKRFKIYAASKLGKDVLDTIATSPQTDSKQTLQPTESAKISETPASVNQSKAPAIVPEPVKGAVEGTRNKSNPVLEKSSKREQIIQRWVQQGYTSLNDVPEQERNEFIEEFRPKSLPPAYSRSSISKLTNIELQAKAAKAATGSDTNVVKRGSEGTKYTPLNQTNDSKAVSVSANIPQPVVPVDQSKAPAIVPETVKAAVSTSNAPVQQSAPSGSVITDKENVFKTWRDKGYKNLNDIPKEELEAFREKYRTKALPKAYADKSIDTEIGLGINPTATRSITKTGPSAAPEPETESKAPAIAPEPAKQAAAPAIVPETVKAAVSAPEVSPVPAPKINAEQERTPADTTSTLIAMQTAALSNRTKTRDIAPVSWSSVPEQRTTASVQTSPSTKTTSGDKILEQIASNTSETTQALASLAAGFNNLARAIREMGTNVPAQPPVVVQAGNNAPSPLKPKSSQYANAGNDEITNFRTRTVEGSRFQPA
jgi:hypothetical protein